MYAYHFTKKSYAVKILSNGFKQPKASWYGSAVYACLELGDNMKYMRKHYGNVIVKIELPDDLNLLKVDGPMGAKQAYADIKAGTLTVDGLVYDCPNHGKVIQVFDSKLVKPLALSYDKGVSYR